MTDENKTQTDFEELIRKHIAEQQLKAQQEQAEHIRILNELNQRAAEVQADILNRPQRQYAAIVAVDTYGGFSKGGQIPWHHPEDFKFFKTTTTGQICVMGRATYDDINKLLGEKAATSVLPDRRCFVVTSRPLERNNATAVSSIGEVDLYLDRDNVPYDKTVFFIGGELIYREGIAKCDTVYMTVVNTDADCDKFFPRNSLLRDFNTQSVTPGVDPNLRFVTWKRHTLRK